jgi:hypothetical protein
MIEQLAGELASKEGDRIWQNIFSPKINPNLFPSIQFPFFKIVLDFSD